MAGLFVIVTEFILFLQIPDSAGGLMALIKALKAKRMTDFDLLLIAVRPDYQDKGVTAMIFDEMTPYFKKYGVKRIETTAILENNHKSLANFQEYDHIQHKRRRAYIKEL